MAYLTEDQLIALKFKHVGKNVKVSDKASIYNPQNIYLGDHCRIDDFCVLSAGVGGIYIGKYTHIAVYVSLIGASEIYIGDFVGLSSRVSIYSSNDDYTGEFMTPPTLPDRYRKVFNAPVFIGKHAIVGSGSVILPGAKLAEGVAVGALSLVVQNTELQPFTIYAGIPVKTIKSRKRNLLDFEKKFNESLAL